MYQQFFLILAILVMSFAACRKTPVTYTINASVDDAKSSRIWLHYNDGYYYNQGYSDRTAWRRAKLDSLASREGLNANDAEIQSVVIKYKDAKGKQIEIKDFSQDGSQGSKSSPFIEDKYSKSFEIPRSASDIIISVKAWQTGETMPIEGDGEIRKDARLSDAAVTLKVEVLKNGKLVGSEQKRATGKVEIVLDAGK